MKRAPELRELSDHHHRGLVRARRLRRAATGDEANPPEETAEAFLEFWQERTTAHFREEEEVLLPVLARSWLRGALVVSLALQILVVYAPFLQPAFGTMGLSLGDWLVCVAVASSVVWLREVSKLFVSERY